MPNDAEDAVPVAGTPAEITVPATQGAPTALIVSPPPPEIGTLQVGGLDERGNTVKYIYSRDQDYVVYYSRLQHRTADAEPQAPPVNLWERLAQLRPTNGPAYESEGVQAQLSPDPTRRPMLRSCLLPLGVERAKLQALLHGWPRRQSYDSSIATALQLALDGGGTDESRANALQTLQDARASILTEREIAGRSQYVRFTLLLGLVGTFLLVLAQHNLLKGSGNFWLGAQAGLLGAIMSIAIGIRRRTVALDIGVAGNLSDSALRLIIGAVSGGTLVLLFSTGLLPALHTVQGEQDGVQSMTFALLLGIIAGFVEQLVPSLLEDQAQRFRADTPRQVPAVTPALTPVTGAGH